MASSHGLDGRNLVHGSGQYIFSMKDLSFFAAISMKNAGF
jgi:hypothetical protein